MKPKPASHKPDSHKPDSHKPPSKSEQAAELVDTVNNLAENLGNSIKEDQSALERLKSGLDSAENVAEIAEKTAKLAENVKKLEKLTKLTQSLKAISKAAKVLGPLGKIVGAVDTIMKIEEKIKAGDVEGAVKEAAETATALAASAALTATAGTVMASGAATAGAATTAALGGGALAGAAGATVAVAIPLAIGAAVAAEAYYAYKIGEIGYDAAKIYAEEDKRWAARNDNHHVEASVQRILNKTPKENEATIAANTAPGGKWEGAKFIIIKGENGAPDYKKFDLNDPKTREIVSQALEEKKTELRKTMDENPWYKRFNSITAQGDYDRAKSEIDL